jgi:polar amino acid transport system substrate-binding protein
MTRPSALLAACCLLFCTRLAAAPPPTVLYTLEYAPYVWQDAGHTRTEGILSDLVVELMGRANVPYAPPVIVPWARGMAKTALTPNTCLFPTVRTPDREAMYDWIGPISKHHWALFARTEDRMRIRDLDDIKEYAVGTMLGDFNVNAFSSRGIRLALVPDDRLNPRKLQLKRIDLWSTELLVGQRMLRDQGITDIEPIFSFIEVDQYLACNRGMPKDDVARLNETIKTMWGDGSIARIYGRYNAEPGLPRRLANPK